MPQPLLREDEIAHSKVCDAKPHIAGQRVRQFRCVRAAPRHHIDDAGARADLRQKAQLRRRRLALTPRAVDTCDRRLRPHRVAAEIRDAVPAPHLRAPLGEGIARIADLEKRICRCRLCRIRRSDRPLERVDRPHLAFRAAWRLHVGRGRLRPPDAQRALDLECRRNAEHFGDLPGVADAGIPDRRIAAQMRAEHHVIAGAGDALHDRELVVRPALLEAEIDQHRAELEVMIAAGDGARALLHLKVGDRHEVPVLMIAGGRRLQPVLDDCADLVSGSISVPSNSRHE